MFIKISRLILLALFFTLILGFFSGGIKDPDFWWHLKSGEYICQTGALPETDPFSYAALPKEPITPASTRIRFIMTQYWLAQVFFYRTYDFFGFQGIIFLRALLLTLLVFLVYRSVRKEGPGIYLSAAMLIPLVTLLRNFTAEKPELFSFLFAFLLIYLIEGFRRRENTVYSMGTNSPLEKRDKRGCAPPMNENASKQPPAPPLLRGNMAADSEDHPHTNPPPSMGREMPSQLVSTSSNDSQPVSTGLNQSQQVSGLYYLIPIPFIMLLWANMHGGVIVGILIILAYVIAEPAKYLLKRFGRPLSARGLKLFLAFGAVSVALTLANPNGYNFIPFLIEFESSHYQSLIIESASPLKLLSMGFYGMQTVIYFVLLAITLMLFLARIKRPDLSDLLLTASLTMSSLYTSTAIPFFCAVSILMIARYGRRFVDLLPLAGRLNAPSRPTEFFSNTIISALLVMILAYGNFFQSGIRPLTFPEGAVQFLRDNRPSGNMFNPYTWGGYLMWSLYPEYKVFTDGRGLIQEVFYQHIRIMEASRMPVAGVPEWKAILNAYRVNYIITYSVWNHSGRLVPLIPALLKDPEWHLVFMDNISLIFLRVTPENMDLIRRFGMPKAWLWNEVAVEAGLKAKSYPWNINFYITMGDAFYAKGSFAEAKNAYQKALERDPASAAARKRMELLRTHGY
jgi:hypothetical protein